MLPCFVILLFPFQFLQAFQLLSFQEFINTTEVFLHLLVTELIHLGHETIEEVTVVRYDNQRTVEIDQCLLQDVLGLGEFNLQMQSNST